MRCIENLLFLAAERGDRHRGAAGAVLAHAAASHADVVQRGGVAGAGRHRHGAGGGVVQDVPAGSQHPQATGQRPDSVQPYNVHDGHGRLH